MGPQELLISLVKRHVPRAVVSIEPDGGHYRLRVVSDHFRGTGRADRQALVYNALERAPLELVARIASIICDED